MGIQGLTSLLVDTAVIWNINDTDDDELRQLSLLHERHSTRDESSNYYQERIHPGSTFAIDGPSFSFYCYRLAYFRYHSDILKSFSESLINKDEDHYDSDNSNLHLMNIISLLLPTLLPYSYIHRTVMELMDAFQSCQMKCVVFLEDMSWVIGDQDGHTNQLIFKEDSKLQRYQQRARAKETLKSFLLHQILPSSFASTLKSSSVGIKNRIPSPNVFLQEFPIPTLLHTQVQHTLICYAQEHDNVQIRFCLGECDRAVAMLSSKDTSNTTYVLSNDSDYIIFGPSMKTSQTSEWHTSHLLLQVQYIPLDTLSISVSERSIRATVLNRHKVASQLHVPEYVLFEASIVMGNDYTRSIISKKEVQATINFFVDALLFNHDGNPSTRSNSRSILQKTRDILYGMACLLEKDPSYQVKATDPRSQTYIDFSRSWYTFQDISEFVVTHSHAEETSSKEDANHELLQALCHDEATIQKNILDLFTRQSQEEGDSSSAATIISSMDYIDFANAPFDSGFSYFTSTQHSLYHHHNISIRFQKCIRQVWKQLSRSIIRDKDSMYDVTGNIIDVYDFNFVPNRPKQILLHGPAHLFDPCRFLNYISWKLNQIASTTVNPIPLLRADVTPTISLPVDEHKNEILSSISKSRVTIIQGESGCGKSSRVPLMILDEHPPAPEMKEVKMFICQPRRIAAKSLLERVRSISPDHLRNKFALRMGHGHHEYDSKDASAFFVTTGYMLRYAANNMESFKNVTHLIIDEVHERSVDSDILCLIAKRLLSMHSHLRLILMSATMEAEKYRDYFETHSEPIFVGTRCHMIKELFLEDIDKEIALGSKELQQVDYIRRTSLEFVSCLRSPTLQYMAVLHRLAVLLATAVARPGSSVLIFVPGISDIIAITELFQDLVTTANYVIFAVHSDLPFEEQMEIFQCSHTTDVKVFVATNAAESSITLPDVDHVFDMGLHKAISYNSKSHRQRLETTWISKASAIQRSGRTGRMRPGNVYRLFPRELYEKMSAFDSGEILRIPLDAVILSLRSILRGPVSNILSECIEPPDTTNMQKAFFNLYKRNFITEPHDTFQFTSIGHLVAELGIDLHLGAMVAMGILFGLAPETIEIAAIISCPQSPWLIPNSFLQDADVYNDIAARVFESKHYFDGGLYSESFATMNLLWDYDRISSHSQRFEFAKDYAISLPRISRVISSRKSLQMRVASYLKIPVRALSVEHPPKAMSSSRLLALRLLKTWLFHDTIICLTAHNYGNQIVSSLKLNGDLIVKSQLSTILKNQNFSLKSICEISYKGRHQALTIDDHVLLVDQGLFESRLLSMAIEKQISILSHSAGPVLRVYAANDIAIQNLDQIMALHDDFIQKNILCYRNLTNHKGWRGRVCGAWKVNQSGNISSVEAAVGIENVKLVRCYMSHLASPYEVMSRITSLMKSFSPLNQQFEVAYIDADSNKSQGSFEVLHHSTRYKTVFCENDFQDLFSTNRIKLTKSFDRYSQEIFFHDNEDTSRQNVPKGSFELTQPTWDLRLLVAVACGQRSFKKPHISFRKSTDDHDLDQGVEYLTGRNVSRSTAYSTVEFNVDHVRGKWKWLSTDGHAVVDNMSIPASLSPLNQDVFGCCGSILELKGDSVLAENITLLPLGTKFLEMAKQCFRIDLPTKRFCDSMEDSWEYHRNEVVEIDTEEENMECAICLCDIQQAQITLCQHVFCKVCLGKLLGENNGASRCPCCRSEIRSNDLKSAIFKQDKQRWENANEFYVALKEQISSYEATSLKFSPQLVTLICKVLDGFGGIEMEPWDEASRDDDPENTTLSKKKMTMLNVGEFLVQNLGRNNLPINFLSLLEETSPDEDDDLDVLSSSNVCEDDDTNVINSKKIDDTSVTDWLQRMLLQQQSMDYRTILSTEEVVMKKDNDDPLGTNHDDVPDSFFEMDKEDPTMTSSTGVDLLPAVLTSRCYKSVLM